MSIYINLLLHAIKPITFFLPCAAIILGSGLAAFDGVVNGSIFSSLLFITMLMQITFNLSGDYQRAFIKQPSNNPQSDQQPNSKPVQHQVKLSMLKLILGCYFVFVTALISLTISTVPGSALGYGIIIFLAIMLLAILRIKSRYPRAVNSPFKIISLLGYGLLLGTLPCLVSYHLHTAALPIYMILLSVCCGLLASLAMLTESIKDYLDNQEQIDSAMIPKPLNKALLLHKLVILFTVIFTLVITYVFNLPILIIFSLLAAPSLFATSITLSHFPEPDIALKQTSKVHIACFAFWILFIVGLMIK